MIVKLIEEIKNKYNLDIIKYSVYNDKLTKIMCSDGNNYLIKKTDLYVNEKYNLLYNQGIMNILYPIKSKDGEYAISFNYNKYLLTEYYYYDYLSKEFIANKIIKELETLHLHTRYKKILTPKKSRKKTEEIFEYLQYKFNILETFVRSVECSNFDENSILILKNYQYILDTKRIMAKLNKLIILDIKNNKSIYYCFIHNNPTNDHLIISKGNTLLISLEKAKMGIPSLDVVKFYLFNEGLNIDIKQIVLKYFSNYDDEFYINYFYFFVMLYYIKGIVIINNNYVTSQSFVYAAVKLNDFIKKFDLNRYK